MELDKLTAEVVRYMLFRSHKQPNVPVKREDLAHLITENYKQRNLPSSVIANAQVCCVLVTYLALRLLLLHS